MTLRRRRPDGRVVAIADDVIILAAPHSYDLSRRDKEAALVLVAMLLYTRKLGRKLAGR